MAKLAKMKYRTVGGDLKINTYTTTISKKIVKESGIDVEKEITVKAVVFIREAEENFNDTTKAGGKKFGQVVTKLYDLVPEGLNKIITKEMIEEIVQSTFNEIEKYAKLQFDKVVDKIPVKKTE